MTDKEMKFAELYIQSGNAVKAAIGAGYSEKTARFASNWLNPLKPTKYKPELAEYIDRLNEQIRTENIMSATERQVMLSDIARNENMEVSARIRAIDTLNKMTGEYKVNVDAAVRSSSKLADVMAQTGASGLTDDELREIAYSDDK